MPREVEPENSSAGMQSPEPLTESSLSPELTRELKDASDAMSEESICSRCGGSKRSRDSGVKPLPPSRLICSCRPKLDKIQQEEENIPLQDCPETDAAVEDIAQIQETVAADQSPTMSTEPSQEDPPVEDIPAQQGQTSGCVEEIRHRGQDELRDCSCCTFTCFSIIFIIVVIVVGIILHITLGGLSSDNTNSISTNFTVDDM